MFTKRGFEHLSKLSIALLLTALLTSCVSFKNFINKHQNQSTQKEIRIVDLDGHHKPIKRYVPEFNARILAGETVGINNKKEIKKQEAPSNNINSANNVTLNDQATQQQNNVVVNNNDKITQKPAEIEYDLSSSSPTPMATKTPQPNQTKKKKEFKVINKNESKDWKNFVQIGSFSSQKSAQEVLSKSSKISSGIIQESKYKNKKLYRVLLGPTKNKQKARIILKQAINSGHKDAFIVKSK